MKHLLSAQDIIDLEENPHQHQFNDNAIRLTKSIGAMLGLERIGIHLVRLEPGRDSTQHHSHEADEEFIYILSGRGTAYVGDESSAVGAGDFMAFPTPSSAHSLCNTSDADLVYLVGGERNLPDVVYYPRLGRTMMKTQEGKRWMSWQDIHSVEG